MQKQIVSTRSTPRRLTVLALLALGVVLIGILALLPIVMRATNSPMAAVNPTTAEVSLAKKRAEEHQWLAQRAAANTAVTAAIQRQEALKDQWLERGTMGIAGLSPIQRQEALKDQWIERANVPSSSQPRPTWNLVVPPG